MSKEYTLLQVVEIGENHENPSFRQYAKQTLLVMKWRGCERSDLAHIVADVKSWLEYAPKYNARSATLLGDLPWKKKTYQQYQKGGRLLIEHVTGVFAEKAERKAINDDTWADLYRKAEALAKAGLLTSPQRLAGLSRICDAARAALWQSTDLTNERVMGLKARANSTSEWDSLKRGAALLDDLRTYPTLLACLPALPIGRIKTRRAGSFVVPQALEAEVKVWIKNGTTIYPDGVESEALRKALAKSHSKGATGVYRAALRSYIDTLGLTRDLSSTERLIELFAPDDIIAVLTTWIAAAARPGGNKPSTMYQYLDDIRLILDRNGQAEAARNLEITLETHPLLIQGKAAKDRMSPKNQKWCLELIDDVRKTQIFETQHVRYAELAKATLKEAAAEKFDLIQLANDPEALQRLSAKRRARAKKLICRARMFGTCAAFAAIELEGAPFREDNTLSLTRSGAKQTFFDHTTGPDPFYQIIIPNEMLKNGEALTKRGQELPPIDIRKRGPDDVGVVILKFYFNEIRPLFPHAKFSNAVFPSVKANNPFLCAGTFSNWLLACSSEIGFRLTSHNFRHGHCSIQINDDPGCIEELAVFLGDLAETVRKYYAFLDRGAVLNTMQDKIAERRAKYRAGRGLKGRLAA